MENREGKKNKRYGENHELRKDFKGVGKEVNKGYHLTKFGEGEGLKAAWGRTKKV